MTSNFLKMFDTLSRIRSYIHDNTSVSNDDLRVAAKCDDHSYGVALNRLMGEGKIRRDELDGEIVYTWIGE